MHSSDKNALIMRDFIVLFLYFFVACSAIIGNLFVIYVIQKTPKFKTSTFLILTNMAISDVLG